MLPPIGPLMVSSLAAAQGDHLAALTLPRRVQLIIGIFESRKQAAFRDSWRS
jgi:hypothetical protein